jgi:GAF domain-containing protein
VLQSDDPVAAGTAAIGRFFVGDTSLGETLTKVAELARDALSADMAGITLLVGGKLDTAVFTDPTAPEIDVWQYETTGRGPCRDAFHEQTVFRIDDTAHEQRWPQFVTAARRFGIVSTLSIPLTRTGSPLGALNLYARRPSAFVVDDELAVTLAGQAAVVLANAHVLHTSRELNENLNQALVSRRTIDYAIGILMSTGGRTPEEAFEMLVRASQRENRKLRAIAADIVAAAQVRRHDDVAPS